MSFLQKVSQQYEVRAASATWYHLTDRAKFKLDPKFAPADNAFALEDRSGRLGIYLAPDIERWIHGHGYWRPFVAEFRVDTSVQKDPGVHGRWGGEMFIPASSFDKIVLQRVIPIDAYCREKYGDYGWIENALEQEFDTGNPIPQRIGNISPLRGYKYTGLDVRDMPASETLRLKQQLKKGKKIIS